MMELQLGYRRGPGLSAVDLICAVYQGRPRLSPTTTGTVLSALPGAARSKEFPQKHRSGGHVSASAIQTSDCGRRHTSAGGGPAAPPADDGPSSPVGDADGTPQYGFTHPPPPLSPASHSHASRLATRACGLLSPGGAHPPPGRRWSSEQVGSHPTVRIWGPYP